MAKSWILGLQFLTLLQDDLYLQLGRHSNQMAQELKTIFSQHNFSFTILPQTNQLFVNIPNKFVDDIMQNYSVYSFGQPDNEHTCLRFCTSWATTQDDIEQCKCFFKKMSQK